MGQVSEGILGSELHTPRMRDLGDTSQALSKTLSWSMRTPALPPVTWDSHGGGGGAVWGETPLPPLTITHHSLGSRKHGDGNQATLVPRPAWAVPGLRATTGSCTGRTLLTTVPLLTRSLTRGMGFRFRMSGILSMMMRPPPGLQDTQGE